MKPAILFALSAPFIARAAEIPAVTAAMKPLVESGEVAGMVTLADLTRVVAAKPLQFKPGSQWRYCQSSINTATRIVEVVSGETFPEFLDKRLFGPLGMKDTTFYPIAKQLPRLATSYSKAEGGKLTATSLHFLFGKPPSDTKRYPPANGGLFSIQRAGLPNSDGSYIRRAFHQAAAGL